MTEREVVASPELTFVPPENFVIWYKDFISGLSMEQFLSDTKPEHDKEPKNSTEPYELLNNFFNFIIKINDYHFAVSDYRDDQDSEHLKKVKEFDADHFVAEKSEISDRELKFVLKIFIHEVGNVIYKMAASAKRVQYLMNRAKTSGETFEKFYETPYSEPELDVSPKVSIQTLMRMLGNLIIVSDSFDLVTGKMKFNPVPATEILGYVSRIISSPSGETGNIILQKGEWLTADDESFIYYQKMDTPLNLAGMIRIITNLSTNLENVYASRPIDPLSPHTITVSTRLLRDSDFESSSHCKLQIIFDDIAGGFTVYEKEGITLPDGNVLFRHELDKATNGYNNPEVKSNGIGLETLQRDITHMDPRASITFYNRQAPGGTSIVGTRIIVELPLFLRQSKQTKLA